MTKNSKTASFLERVLQVLLLLTVTFVLTVLFFPEQENGVDTGVTLQPKIAEVPSFLGIRGMREFKVLLAKSRLLGNPDLETFAKDYWKLVEGQRAKSLAQEKFSTTFHRKEQQLISQQLDGKTYFMLDVPAASFDLQREQRAEDVSLPLLTYEETLPDDGLRIVAFAPVSELEEQSPMEKKLLEYGEKGSPNTVRIIFAPYHFEAEVEQTDIAALELRNLTEKQISKMNDVVTLERVRLLLHGEILGAAEILPDGSIKRAIVQKPRARPQPQ